MGYRSRDAIWRFFQAVGSTARARDQPTAVMASLKGLTISATCIARRLAPINSTPLNSWDACSASTPRQSSVVWPPTVGSDYIRRFTLLMIFSSSVDRVSGSM